MVDLKNEPADVYKNLEYYRKYFKTTYRFEIQILQPGNIYQDMLDYIKGDKSRCASIPLYVLNSDGSIGFIRRQCTSDYKIIPIQKRVKELAGKKQIYKWLGISYDEIERTKISQVKSITNYYPLVDNKIRLSEIIQWFRNNALPIPAKSSCIICPFHSDSYWLYMFLHRPEEFESACAFDEAVRKYPGIRGTCYLHRSCKPLREIILKIWDNKIKENKQTEMFPELIEECDGHCGT